MSIASEFKEFAMKGNVIDMAVGVIIGAAFGKIVSSLVGDVIMPIIGILFGEPSFDNLVLTVNDSVIRYGSFLTAAVTFAVTALGLFLFVVRPFQAYQARRAAGEPEADVVVPEEIQLLREIRDTLRAG